MNVDPTLIVGFAFNSANNRANSRAQTAELRALREEVAKLNPEYAQRQARRERERIEDMIEADDERHKANRAYWDGVRAAAAATPPATWTRGLTIFVLVLGLLIGIAIVMGQVIASRI